MGTKTRAAQLQHGHWKVRRQSCWCRDTPELWLYFPVRAATASNLYVRMYMNTYVWVHICTHTYIHINSLMSSCACLGCIGFCTQDINYYSKLKQNAPSNNTSLSSPLRCTYSRMHTQCDTAIYQIKAKTNYLGSVQY